MVMVFVMLFVLFVRSCLVVMAATLPKGNIELRGVFVMMRYFVIQSFGRINVRKRTKSSLKL